jgi:hypothetical protein
MTPKEKAEELYSKYYNRIEHSLSEDISGFEKDIVKHCALIAVDELIEEQGIEEYNNGTWHRLNYWIEVKEEIENL